MPGGQPALNTTKGDKVVIYSPIDVAVDKFYGNGRVGETDSSGRMEIAWEYLQLISKKRISLLYEKIWKEVEFEIKCHLEGRPATSDQILDIIRKCYKEKRIILALRSTC